MPQTDILPGLELPTAEQARQRKLQHVFHVIMTDYDGDVVAYLAAKSEPAKTKHVQRERLRWESVQRGLQKICASTDD